MKKKHINILEARDISKKFCKDFKVPYCEIYFVDKLGSCWGLYSWLDPAHMLVLKNNPCMIGIVMHELTHHLQSHQYPINSMKESHHGYTYQLSKKKVVKWCNKNLSDKPNWRLPLQANPNNKDMKNFRL